MKIEGYEAIIPLATGTLTLVTKLVFLITESIQNSDLTQEDKDVLIAKIKEAQAKIPEWK